MPLDQAVIEQTEHKWCLCLNILYPASTMQCAYATWLRWGGGLMQGGSTLLHIRPILERTGYLPKGMMCASKSDGIVHNRAICRWGFRATKLYIYVLIFPLHVLGWFFSASFKWATIVWFTQEVHASGLTINWCPLLPSVGRKVSAGILETPGSSQNRR